MVPKSEEVLKEELARAIPGCLLDLDTWRRICGATYIEVGFIGRENSPDMVIRLYENGLALLDIENEENGD